MKFNKTRGTEGQGEREREIEVKTFMHSHIDHRFREHENFWLYSETNFVEKAYEKIFEIFKQSIIHYTMQTAHCTCKKTVSFSTIWLRFGSQMFLFKKMKCERVNEILWFGVKKKKRSGKSNLIYIHTMVKLKWKRIHMWC